MVNRVAIPDLVKTRESVKFLTTAEVIGGLNNRLEVKGWDQTRMVLAIIQAIQRICGCMNQEGWNRELSN